MNCWAVPRLASPLGRHELAHQGDLASVERVGWALSEHATLVEEDELIAHRPARSECYA